MIQKVLKVGSSAAVTIPKKSLEELGLKIGDEVSINIQAGSRKVTIEPAHEVSAELVDWTKSFIKKYKKDLDALARQ